MNEQLAELPELNLLVAGVTKATAEGFRPFRNSKSLKTVVVYGNAFKNGRTEEVRNMLPGVEVEPFDLFLSTFKRTTNELILYRFILGDT